MARRIRSGLLVMMSAPSIVHRIFAKSSGTQRMNVNECAAALRQTEDMQGNVHLVAFPHHFVKSHCRNRM